MESTDFERYSYKSPVIDRLRTMDHRARCGRLSIRCARNFGFCWGVDRAVSMVHEAIESAAGRRIWVLSQIIHNPTVNRDLVARGVQFLKGEGAPEQAFERVRPDDVVVIPAFSAEIADLRRLKSIGCTVLDTTCPWVERPHRRAERLGADGYTLVIHGKVDHDETRATCSLIRSRGGAYVVVLDLDETEELCRYLRGDSDGAALRDALGRGMSPGFEPERDLQKLGVINQTTMLATESRAISRRLEAAMRERHGAEGLRGHFQDFDTICSATQENQDAVLALVDDPELDLMIVVGGYESSNTNNLARVAAERVPTYHIEDAAAISADAVVHKRLDSSELVRTARWLPAGNVTVGFTAGASTPDDTLGAVIEKVIEAAGEDPGTLGETP
jgi:4-hydroxy-3-methylbut-2-enyl diphosphate reductase